MYFYTDCYLRFCCHAFTLDNLDNKYVHLANNSIQKKSKKFKNLTIPGNMWHSDQFIQHIEDTFVRARLSHRGPRTRFPDLTPLRTCVCVCVWLCVCVAVSSFASC